MTMGIDPGTCMWCGACVGICPINAVTLHETRIVFEPQCTDCEICLKFCPVGSIWHDTSKPPTSQHLSGTGSRKSSGTAHAQFKAGYVPTTEGTP